MNQHDYTGSRLTPAQRNAADLGAGMFLAVGAVLGVAMVLFAVVGMLVSASWVIQKFGG